MLTNEQLIDNKNEFIDMLRAITRNNCDIEGLIKKLEQSDFFEAPASTKYHGAFKGGLCRHCLDVNIVLTNLLKMNGLSYSDEAVTIVSLLHDLSKMNLYERTCFNKKVYSENGSKHDDGGKFDWVSEPGYKTKDVKDRFIYGNHEQTSEFMVRQFIPLELEESIAILHHHGGMGFDSAQLDISLIYDKYPLALMLHVADMICAYMYC